MRRFRDLIAMLLVVGSLFALVPAYAAEDSASATQSALRWLTTRQQADGSFPGFGPGSTADIVYALAAAGIDPNGVLNNGNSPISALGNTAATFAKSSLAADGKLILAVIAADKDPRSFGGQDLVAILQQGYHPATGIYGANPTDHAFAILALASAGQPIPAAAISAADRLQRADGGWSFDGGATSTSDTNTAALMIQAYVAAGTRNAALTKAVAYLKSQQNTDGGFTYSKQSQYGSDSDANSTALSIQALVAIGEDPRALKQAGGDPITALLAFQNSSGAFRYQAAFPDDNDIATAQAIPALLLKPLPIKRLPAIALPVPATLPNTGGENPMPWAVLVAGMLFMAGFALRRRI
jgi:LPXTG-motif cell wall-anchored protein